MLTFQLVSTNHHQHIAINHVRVHQKHSVSVLKYLSNVSHELPGVELRHAEEVRAVGLVDPEQRQVQGGGQLHAQTSTTCYRSTPWCNYATVPLTDQDLAFGFFVKLVCGCTFKKVALSLVTMDGLTLILSRMMLVKLQETHGVNSAHNNNNSSILST